MIKRSTHVIVEYIQSYKDQHAIKEEWKGFEAVVFQHLIDHVKEKNHFDVAQDVELMDIKEKCKITQ